MSLPSAAHIVWLFIYPCCILAFTALILRSLGLYWLVQILIWLRWCWKGNAPCSHCTVRGLFCCATRGTSNGSVGEERVSWSVLDEFSGFWGTPDSLAPSQVGLYPNQDIQGRLRLGLCSTVSSAQGHTHLQWCHHVCCMLGLGFL